MKEGGVFSALLARASASRTTATLDDNATTTTGHEKVEQHQDEKRGDADVSPSVRDERITTPNAHQPRGEFTGRDDGTNGDGADDDRNMHAEVFSTPGEGIVDTTK